MPPCNEVQPLSMFKCTSSPVLRVTRVKGRGWEFITRGASDRGVPASLSGGEKVRGAQSSDTAGQRRPPLRPPPRNALVGMSFFTRG